MYAKWHNCTLQTLNNLIATKASSEINGVPVSVYIYIYIYVIGSEKTCHVENNIFILFMI